MQINFSADFETAHLRGKSRASDNTKINANFLFGGFIASYESLCVNDPSRRSFVSAVVRELPQIKNKDVKDSFKSIEKQIEQLGM